MGRQKQYQKSTVVRLTDDEYRQVMERAKQSGVSLSRLLAESTLTDKPVINELKEQTERLIFQRDWAINQVGHSTIQMSARYTHATDERKRRAVENMSGSRKSGHIPVTQPEAAG